MISLVELRPESPAAARARRERPGKVRAWRLGAAALLAGALLAAPAARADSLAREGGLGAASVFSTLVYGPVKTTYALLGLMGAGFAYAFSGGDADVAGPVLDASVRGDWVLTPRHLTGEEEIEFVGRRPEDRAARERWDIEDDEPPPAF